MAEKRDLELWWDIFQRKAEARVAPDIAVVSSPPRFEVRGSIYLQFFFALTLDIIIVWCVYVSVCLREALPTKQNITLH